MSAPARLRRWFLAALIGSGLGLLATSVNGIAQMDATLQAAAQTQTETTDDRDCPERVRGRDTQDL